MFSISDPFVPLPGALDPGDVALPILFNMGGVAAAAAAVNAAVESPIVAVLTGDRGAGRSLGLAQALRGYSSLWLARRLHFAGSAAPLALRLSTLRGDDWRGLAEDIAYTVGAPIRFSGSEPLDEVSERLASACSTGGVALVVVDEVDLCSEEFLVLLLGMAAASRRRPDGGHIGLVLSGVWCEGQLGGLGGGAGLVRYYPVRALDSAGAVKVFGTWFPGFSSAIAELGAAAWQQLLLEKVCIGGEVSFRQVETLARIYVYELGQQELLWTRDEIPLNVSLFVRCAEHLGWRRTG